MRDSNCLIPSPTTTIDPDNHPAEYMGLPVYGKQVHIDAPETDNVMLVEIPGNLDGIEIENATLAQ